MKHLFTIVFFFFISCKSQIKSDNTRGNQYDLEGKIIEEVELTAGCGVISWGTVIVFSIYELKGLTYPNKNIGIVITCPGDYDKNFFEVDKNYKVTFSDKNQANFEWLIPNKDLLKKNGLSFDPYAIKVIKIP